MTTDQFGKKWYKGNLHTHSTNSDGRLSPEEVIGLYREEGYDFLALTDHWFMGEERQEENFLLLSGAEYDVGNNVRDGIYHVVGIGMQKEPKLEKGPELQEKQAQLMIDRIWAALSFSSSLKRSFESIVPPKTNNGDVFIPIISKTGERCKTGLRKIRRNRKAGLADQKSSCYTTMRA